VTMTGYEGLVYLDFQATTPVDESVLDSMIPFFSTSFGNPSSVLHGMGRAADKVVGIARKYVAQLIGAKPPEIVFTGSATESINLAIQGMARARDQQKKLRNRSRVITTAIEHKAVLEVARALQRTGWHVEILPVEVSGDLDIELLTEALDEDVLLVSVQAANQEIATVQAIERVASIAHRYGAAVHCDASQAVGKIPIDVETWDVDLLSFSGHKIYGPKGIGVLYVRNDARGSGLEPLIYGGGQEYGLRSGTENVPAIVGLGQACKLAKEFLQEEGGRLKLYRDHLEELLARSLDVKINGDRDNRLPGATSVTFKGVDAEALIFQAPRLMLSTGSACSSGAPEPSHVLTAIGLNRSDAWATIRMSFGRPSREEDVEEAAEALIDACRAICSA